jgi:8-oxo-dGTP pyrophosphatase MutT (NUDIX family)
LFAIALLREVLEETGAYIRVRGIVGVYGGQPMIVTYPNGDQVGYVTTAYDCELLSPASPDPEELLELSWFERDAVRSSACSAGDEAGRGERLLP